MQPQQQQQQNNSDIEPVNPQVPPPLIVPKTAISSLGFTGSNNYPSILRNTINVDKTIRIRKTQINDVITSKLYQCMLREKLSSNTKDNKLRKYRIFYTMKPLAYHYDAYGVEKISIPKNILGSIQTSNEYTGKYCLKFEKDYGKGREYFHFEKGDLSFNNREADRKLKIVLKAKGTFDIGIKYGLKESDITKIKKNWGKIKKKRSIDRILTVNEIVANPPKKKQRMSTSIIDMSHSPPPVLNNNADINATHDFDNDNDNNTNMDALTASEQIAENIELNEEIAELDRFGHTINNDFDDDDDIDLDDIEYMNNNNNASNNPSNNLFSMLWERAKKGDATAKELLTNYLNEQSQNGESTKKQPTKPKKPTQKKTIAKSTRCCWSEKKKIEVFTEAAKGHFWSLTTPKSILNCCQQIVKHLKEEDAQLYNAVTATKVKIMLIDSMRPIIKLKTLSNTNDEQELEWAHLMKKKSNRILALYIEENDMANGAPKLNHNMTPLQLEERRNKNRTLQDKMSNDLTDKKKLKNQKKQTVEDVELELKRAVVAKNQKTAQVAEITIKKAISALQANLVQSVMELLPNPQDTIGDTGLTKDTLMDAIENIKNINDDPYSAFSYLYDLIKVNKTTATLIFGVERIYKKYNDIF